MGEPLEYSCYYTPGSVLVLALSDNASGYIPFLALFLDFVAEIQDELPILRSQVLVCRLV